MNVTIDDPILRGGRDDGPRSVRDVVDLVEQFESECGLEAPKEELWLGRRSGLRRLPRTFRRHLLRLRARRGPSVEFVARIGASRVKVKNNLLLFYREEGHVAKLFSTEEALDRHLQGLRASEVFRSARTPDLISFGHAPTPWVIHPVVGSRKPNPREWRRSAPDLLVDLARLHAQHISVRTLGIVEEERTTLRELAEALGLRLGTFTQASLSGDIEVEALHGPVHGDVSPGNCIADEGLFVLDWELYGPDFVVRDLRSFGHRFFSEYGSALRGLGVTEHLDSISTQAAIYAMKRLAASTSSSYSANALKKKRQVTRSQRNAFSRIEALLQDASVRVTR